MVLFLVKKFPFFSLVFARHLNELYSVSAHTYSLRIILSSFFVQDLFPQPIGLNLRFLIFIESHLLWKMMHVLGAYF